MSDQESQAFIDFREFWSGICAAVDIAEYIFEVRPKRVHAHVDNPLSEHPARRLSENDLVQTRDYETLDGSRYTIHFRVTKSGDQSEPLLILDTPNHDAVALQRTKGSYPGRFQEILVSELRWIRNKSEG